MRPPARSQRSRKPSTSARMREEIEEDEPSEADVVEEAAPSKRPVPAWGWIVATILIGACSLIIGYALYEIWTN